MATSKRSITVSFSGSLDIGNLSYGAPENADSPGIIDLITLAAGANELEKPDDAQAVTIILPEDNEVAITLKGISGDTGILLHLTAPTSIGLADGVTTLVLTAAAEIAGVRLIWS